MSRKNFIITALLINLTICITLCIVVFTDKDNVENKGEIVVEKDSSTILADENKEDSNNSDKDITYNIENTTEENSQETSSKTPGIIIDNTSEESTDDETTKIVESQVHQDTPPATYIDIIGITLNNGEETTDQQTTEPQEPVVIDGTIAVMTRGCNIRSSTDVNSDNKIGTAKAGDSYKIAKDKCASNWTAIYLDDNTIGYVSSSFCTYN